MNSRRDFHRLTFLTASVFFAFSAMAEEPPLAPAPPVRMQMLEAVVAGAAVSTAPLKVNDWVVTEALPSEESPQGSCVASTTANLASEAFVLEVIIDKVGAKPAEIRIRPATGASQAAGFFANSDVSGGARSKAVPELFLKSTQAKDGTIAYWNLPRSTSALLSTLRRGLRFDVLPTGTAVLPGKPPAGIPFSLRGSSRALDELGRRCPATAIAETDSFEKVFLPANIRTVDPAKFAQDSVATLRQVESAGFVAYRSSEATQDQIDELAKKYQALMAQVPVLQKKLEVVQRDVDQATQQRTKVEAAVASLDSEKSGFSAQVAVSEKQLNDLKTNYEAAFNELSPLKPEYDRLDGLFSAAHDQTQSADQRVDGLNESINNTNQQLQSLQSELASTQADLGNAQSEASQARAVKADADLKLSLFVVSDEVRRRTLQDGSLQQNEQEIRFSQGRLDEMRRFSEQARRDVERRREELERCQRPAGSGSSGGGPGPDCSAQQREFQGARDRVEKLFREIRDTESRLGFLQSQVEQRKRDIELGVFNDRDALAARASDASGKLSVADDRVRTLQSHIEEVARVTLPNSRAERESLRRELRDAEANLAKARVTEQAARAQLDQYRASVSYDQKKAAVDALWKQLGGVNAELARLDREIKKRDRQIADQKKAMAALTARIESGLSTIRQEQEQSEDLKKRLAEMDQARSQLTSAKAVSDKALDESKIAFGKGIDSAQ